MAKKIVIQRMGQTMKEGTIVRWLKNDMDSVKANEVIYELEYDKSSVEVESPIDGVIHIMAAQGSTLPVGTIVAMVYAQGERPEDFSPKAQDEKPNAHIAANDGEIQISASAKRLMRQKGIEDFSQIVPANGRRITDEDVLNFLASSADSHDVKATPYARRIAEANSVDLAKDIENAGSKKIIAGDVLDYIARRDDIPPCEPSEADSAPITAASESPAAPDKRVAMSAMRLAIANNMSTSYFQSPVVTYFVEIDMTAFLKTRAELNDIYAARNVKISVNDLLITAVAKALRKCPYVNVTLEDKTIVYKSQINVGIAVALREGLIVPVVKDADKLTPDEIAKKSKALIDRAREGKLSPDDTQGGTFTLTNLGNKCVDAFTPIIRSPEAAILGVGRIAEKPVVINGEIAIRPMMTAALTADHRMIDGAPASDFLQELKNSIEKPLLMFL